MAHYNQSCAQETGQRWKVVTLFWLQAGVVPSALTLENICKYLLGTDPSCESLLLLLFLLLSPSKIK